MREERIQIVQNLKKNKALQDQLFIICFCLYAAATFLQYTMFNEYPLIATGCILMRDMTFLLTFVKVVCDFSLEITEHGSLRKRLWKEMGVQVLRILVPVGIALLVSRNAGNWDLLFLTVILLGARGVEAKRLFRAMLYLQIGLLLVTSFASTLGIIPDLLFRRSAEGLGIRHSMGFTYPSVLTAAVFFTIVLYALVEERKMSARTCIKLLLLSYLLYIITDSRLAFIMITALILVIGLTPYWEDRWQSVSLTVRKWTGIALDLLPVWLCLLTLVLCLLYPTAFGQKLNSLTSERIKLTVNGFCDFGITLFGQSIEWIGYGGTDNTLALADTYNFVDNSYASFLLNYGIVAFVVLIGSLIYIIHKVRTHYSCRYTILVIMVLLYCFIDLNLITIHLNPILFLAVVQKRHLALSSHYDRKATT